MEIQIANTIIYRPEQQLDVVQAKRRHAKAEQKEKEKRQRERLRSLEIQRDKLHKAAWKV
ncbi:hypothetical protein ANCCEY_08703 [Ancylostoma ceylanicum]|uniref:Uncharacterized protein n=1 Tax=Ancylostoma ceylanicum TaxID=53326 RepID=A0A0D6LJP4_9BILA|nr:hypothetical protein ANCCEY_08703 [Ancylostoma ceylanicum]